jgi:glycosyltransferase involved in cell wall biosynthesis
MPSVRDITIDAFRLTTEQRTSGFYFTRNLINALMETGRIGELRLLLPRNSHSSLNELGVQSSRGLRAIYPERACYPEESFTEQVFWTQIVIPRLAQTTNSDDLLILPYHHTPLRFRALGTVVTVIHDTCGITRLFPKSKKGYYQHLWMLWTAARAAEVLVPISGYTRATFLRNFAPSRGLVTERVWNCTDGNSISDCEGSAKLSLLKIQPYRYFFAIGAPGLRKGFDRCAEAFAAYTARGGQLDLVVMTSSASADAVQSTLTEAGPNLRCQIVLDLPDEVRDALYWGAVAFLFPSRCEGFGYPVVEAMRQGCPAIVPTAGPFREILGLGPPDNDDSEWDSNSVLEQMFELDKLTPERRREIALNLKRRSPVFSSNGYGDRFLKAVEDALVQRGDVAGRLVQDPCRGTDV